MLVPTPLERSKEMRERFVEYHIQASAECLYSTYGGSLCDFFVSRFYL